MLSYRHLLHLKQTLKTSKILTLHFGGFCVILLKYGILFFRGDFYKTLYSLPLRSEFSADRYSSCGSCGKHSVGDLSGPLSYFNVYCYGSFLFYRLCTGFYSVPSVFFKNLLLRVKGFYNTKKRYAFYKKTAYEKKLGSVPERC